MDLFNIPNDDGKTYRKKVFTSLLKNPELGYVDGATDYCLLIPFSEQFNLDLNQRVWLAFLYSVTYSQTTSMRFFKRFPNPEKIKKQELFDFWEENKDTLWFPSDRRHLKNNDQVIPAVVSFLKNSKRKPEEYIRTLDEFNKMYTTIKRDWLYYGPMGAYLFFDGLYGLAPELYLDPDVLDWKNCCRGVVVEGMALFCYEDELLKTHDFPYDKYNRMVEKIQEKTGQPKIIIESTLCAYRKFFKGTRYFGYYADRVLEECYFAEKYMPEDVDIWEYREKTIPNKFLGEKNGWKGIRKKNMSIWRKTGKLE